MNDLAARLTAPLLALGAVLGAPAAALFGAVAPDGPLLVVAPPWRDPVAVIAAAGGWPVGPQRAPMAVLATDGGAADGTDFARRLRLAGAWAVLDGAALARLCGATS